MTTPKSQTVEVDVTVRTLPHVEHTSLKAALAAFQAEVPSVRKGNEASVVAKNGAAYKYAYADLSDVTEKALPILGKHGLSFSAIPTMDPDRGFILEYSLSHESGELSIGVYPLPDPLQVTPQALGSAITYARRYALCAVTGVAPGGDDEDAHAAQPSTAQSAPKQVAPSRDWVAAAKDADTKDAADMLWDAARKSVTRGLDPKWILDEIAAVWRDRKAAQTEDTTIVIIDDAKATGDAATNQEAGA